MFTFIARSGLATTNDQNASNFKYGIFLIS